MTRLKQNQLPPLVSLDLSSLTPACEVSDESEVEVVVESEPTASAFVSPPPIPKGAGDSGRVLPAFATERSQSVASQLAARSGQVPTSGTLATTSSQPVFAADTRIRFLNAAADVIEKHRAEFSSLLQEVNTPFGAEYEITQAVKTLRGVEAHEGRYLQGLDPLKSVAIYASRNIPLYTLVMHGLIPAASSQQVWMRTPKQTSDLYLKLFDKLRQHLPEFDLSNLNVLPPVYYDEFYKQHVLGLHQKGKRMQEGRSAANAVVFVGSPETGEQIRTQITTKLSELGGKVPAVRQAFMMFGTGLNPVVITPFAKNQLDAAVRDAVTAVRINNAQDCIAPKLYAVHSSMKKEYLQKLTTAFSSLRFGELRDKSADYTALTFTDRVDALAAFRAKHQKYLVTEQAVLDETTKRVDPHVFVFPYSKFKSGEVELADHYAPFFVMFTYDTDAELKEMSCDPRVRERAMFASLYGDPSNKEMFRLRKSFEDNFHTTTLNLSVFDEESGNFPFGGYGGKASSVTLIEKDDGNNVRTTTMERPLLFTKVAHQFFKAKGKALPPATVLSAAPHPKSRERLAKMLKTAGDESKRNEVRLFEYSRLKQPQFAQRPRGLGYLREQIQAKGLSVVYHRWASDPEGARMLRTTSGQKELQEFFGAKVVDFVALPGNDIHKVPGVLLHSSPVGWDVKAMNRVRGEVNPHLSFGFLNALVSDRVNEFHAIDAVWPGLMPNAESTADLMASGMLGKAFNDQRQAARAAVDTLLGLGRKPSKTELAPLRDALKTMVDTYMKAVQERFPKGAFIKNYGECTTGDLGIQITSFHYNLDNIVDQYLAQFGETAGELGYYAQQAKRRGKSMVDDDKFTSQMLLEVYATCTKFVQKLLNSPEDLLAQERMKIGKTPLGFNQEIRVDFMDGEPVTARSRYSHEYLREEEEEAKAVLKAYFDKAPEQLKYLCGGADLVKLEDGSWKVVELNPGPYSGSISARTFPVETHRFVSVLSGANTPFLSKLEAVATSSAAEQNAFLRKLLVEEEKWNKLSLREVSIAEVGKYIRDRLLDGWRLNPTRESADALVAHLRAAFDGVNSPTVRDLPLLIRGAEDYLQAKLTAQ